MVTMIFANDNFVDYLKERETQLFQLRNRFLPSNTERAREIGDRITFLKEIQEAYSKRINWRQKYIDLMTKINRLLADEQRNPTT